MAADLDLNPLEELRSGALVPDSLPEKGPSEAIHHRIRFEEPLADTVLRK
jgi:hypothetical protein